MTLSSAGTTRSSTRYSSANPDRPVRIAGFGSAAARKHCTIRGDARKKATSYSPATGNRARVVYIPGSVSLRLRFAVSTARGFMP